MRWLLLLLALCAAPAARAADARDVELARQAFRFAYPVHQMAVTRQNALARVEGAGGRVVNAFNHRPTLSDHTHRNVTTPNNDTLYSASWLDLSGGPVVLTMPAAKERYHSVALMDLFTDHFAVLGTRANGGAGGRYLVAGPTWRGRVPAGLTLVRSPTVDAWAILRVLVDGPADLAAARRLQTGFSIEPLDRAAPKRPFAERAAGLDDPARFLAVVNEALGRGPLPAAHARRVARFARVGVVPGDADAWSRLPPAVRAAWRANITRFYDELRGGLQETGREANGWSYPEPGIGAFGTDDLYRSRVALGGLAALPREEAVYLSARTDAQGRPLDGRRAYTLAVPADVPVGAFWSLSLYEIAPDGRLFFTENAIGRYAIGNRTAGVARDAGGGLTIRLQPTPPAGSAAANWLPTPAGPFALTFRAYLPGAELLSDRFELPAVRPAAE